MENVIDESLIAAKCSVDLKTGKILGCSEVFATFTGYDEKYFIKNPTNFFEVVSLSDSSYTLLKNAFSERKEICLQTSLCCGDKSVSSFILYVMSFDDKKNSAQIALIPEITKHSQKINTTDSADSFPVDYALLLKKIMCGIAVYEFCGGGFKQIFSTDRFYEIIGYTKEEYKEITNGGFIGNLINEEDRESLLRKITRTLASGCTLCEQLRMTKKDGTLVFVLASGTAYNTADGKRRLLVVYNDITPSKEKDNLLEAQVEKYKIIEDIADDFIFDYDVEKDTFTLPQRCKVTNTGSNVLHGYIKNDLPRHTVHKNDYWKYIAVIRSASISPQKNYIDIRTSAVSGEYQWHRFHYVSLPDITGKIKHIYGRIENIELEKKWIESNNENEKIIDTLSSTDYVTGLYNRHTFQDKAVKIIRDFDFKYSIALVYTDIDNFSYINDNFGYDEGDTMLFDLASLIKKSEMTLLGSRINSDYFASIVYGQNEQEIFNLVEERDKTFVNLQKSKYAESEIGLATGIYFIRRNDEDFNVMLDNANLARRHVKSDKNINMCVYNDTLRYARNHAKMIISKLKPAIEDGLIEMFLQPKFSIRTRKVIGAEALARWRNSDGTYKFPGQFIDVLEQSGYIGDLDFHIYETALRLIQKWQILGKEPIPISVNFSRVNNNNKDFTQRIIDLADKYGIARQYIELEITESAFSENSKSMLNNLKILREKGFKVDIDDFGIGYSSLSFLLDAPIDVVKVDKLFVDNIDISNRHREYLKQMCVLINTTKKNIIFEGVETETQADFLNSCGFDYAQGWLFDKAISVAEFERKYIN